MIDLPMNRRRFVRGALVGGAALGLGLNGRAARLLAQEVDGSPESGKIGDFKISLAEWSLHKRYFASGDPAEANLDFPRTAKEEFGIDGVEYVNQFFKDKAKDEAYLAELNKRAADHGVTNVLIMIDGEGSLSDEDSAKRDEAVENHKKWVDAAAVLGCHSIRVNTGGNYSASNTEAAAEGCGKLAEYGKSKDINIICENHGGPSSDPDALIALIEAVGMDNFGTLPDFGNFPRRGRGLRDRHLRGDRPDDAVCQGRLGQVLRLRPRRHGDAPRLPPDPEDRHRRRLSRLRRHRVRGRPPLRVRGDQGRPQAPREAPGFGVRGLSADWPRPHLAIR